MTDIAVRLRINADRFAGDQTWVPVVLREAADEIERLSEEIGRLHSDIDSYAIRKVPKLEAEIESMRSVLHHLVSDGKISPNDVRAMLNNLESIKPSPDDDFSPQNDPFPADEEAT